MRMHPKTAPKMENVLIYSLEWSTILFEKLFLIYYPIT
jgi:hypothetical protein